MFKVGSVRGGEGGGLPAIVEPFVATAVVHNDDTYCSRLEFKVGGRGPECGVRGRGRGSEVRG